MCVRIERDVPPNSFPGKFFVFQPSAISQVDRSDIIMIGYTFMVHDDIGLYSFIQLLEERGINENAALKYPYRGLFGVHVVRYLPYTSRTWSSGENLFVWSFTAASTNTVRRLFQNIVFKAEGMRGGTCRTDTASINWNLVSGKRFLKSSWIIFLHPSISMEPPKGYTTFFISKFVKKSLSGCLFG